jgi:hypothetical protein
VRLLFVGVVVALLAESSPADACSGDCLPQHLFLGAGATIPKNVSAFGLAINAEPNVVLKDGVGAVVSTTVVPTAGSFGQGWRFNATVVPSAPLTEGNYSLELSTKCLATGVTSTDSRPFIVGEARALPTDVGTLRVVARAPGKVRVSGSPACVRAFDAAQVGIELVPSASFAPFQSSAVLSVWVDGESWRGTVLASERQTDAQIFDPFTIYASCDPTWHSIPPPGKHTVEVRATIPGTSAVLATTTEVDLSCPAPEPIPVEATATPSLSGCNTSPRPSQPRPF